MKYVLAVLAIAIGVAGVVAGGADDSPGLQLLSVLLIIGACAGREDGQAQQVVRTAVKSVSAQRLPSVRTESASGGR
jgi:hypothetical protein